MEKKGKSGGLTARNFREGFRSEDLAKFIFSAFGTAIQVTQGNDLGIDLLCNLARMEGNLIHFESSYGVQVKSKGESFTYRGKQATTWLSKLEYPLLLAEVDKSSASIKIYSTWPINRFLMGLHSDNEQDFPEEIVFSTSEKTNAQLAEYNKATGVIPVGHPILEFDIKDIGNLQKREEFLKILSQWLDFDRTNYLFRRSGIPRAYGFITWETNKEWTVGEHYCKTDYYYSQHHSSKIRILTVKAMVALALHNKEGYKLLKNELFKERFQMIRKTIMELFSDLLEDNDNDILKDDL